MPTFFPSQTEDRLKVAAKPGEIVIPAWDDIIHIARPPSYTSRELAYMTGIGTQVDAFGWSIEESAKFHELSVSETSQLLEMQRDYKEVGRRQKELAMDMLKSPTPALVKNFGVIMTALDDVQDFTTTVGVVSRLLGRVFKPFDALAIGAFTVGEFLNRLNLLNRLTGGEISKLCRMLREMRNSSHKSRIKSDVDKRMKRLFPSKGEAMEILQTTDQLFGVGISLGPIVGLVQDLFFGAFKGSPIRFKKWTITETEKKGILKAYESLQLMPKELLFDLQRDITVNESAANVVVAAEHLTWQEYATGLVTHIQSGISSRAKEVKKAAVDIWNIISGQKAAPKKKTKTETRLLLSGFGVDPYGPSDWPIDGLGSLATIQDIQSAYEAQANKGLQFWRAKLGVSDEGIFLDACVKEISLHAASMFCAEDGVITESLDPHLLIYINALEAHLNPPPDTSAQKFTEWISFIKQELEYYDIPAPDLKLLQEAHRRFFGV